MKEQQPMAIPNKIDADGNIKPVGRRGFIRGVLAGAGALVLGKEILKSPEGQESAGALYERFKGQEHSFSSAIDAANLLSAEMEMENISYVKLSGYSPKNDRIGILRDFLTRHLNTKGIGEKYGNKNDIFSRGVYNKDNLLYISAVASAILDHKYRAVPEEKQPAQKEDINKRI